MPLQSQLFRGDPKLEAAATSDPAHIVPGARGPHVAKIQKALNALDGAGLDEDGAYGPATAAAVLAYKQARDIVNRSRQTQADNIVGTMTMAALDREMLAREAVPSGPTRFETVFPAQRPARPSAVSPPGASRLLLGFKAGGLLADVIPPLPPSLSFSQSILEVPRQQVGLFRVRNGKGKQLVCQDLSVATMAPLDPPANAHTVSKLTITEDPQEIRVFPKSAGRTSISVRPFGPFDAFMTVVVPAEVGVFFHFLDGPPGVKTARREGDLDAILKTMNDIYQRNHAGMVFVNRGANPRLTVRGLGNDFAGVRVATSGGTADTDAIKASRKADVLFNVFFVGRFIDVTNPDGSQENFLALTSRPPDDDKPLRCCLCRDRLPSDPARIDPGKTLAHEAGHALGEDDDRKDTNSLMFFSQSGATDTRIDAGMADRMMSSFKQFPP
jgi:peptidoglycan hydrolase-like protein with peptidoglycan-binding domain